MSETVLVSSARPRPRPGLLRRIRHADLTFWLSVAWLVLLGLAIVLVQWLPLAEHVDVAETLSEPVFATPTLVWPHPLGTNAFGLDLLSRSVDRKSVV